MLPDFIYHVTTIRNRKPRDSVQNKGPLYFRFELLWLVRKARLLIAIPQFTNQPNTNSTCPQMVRFMLIATKISALNYESTGTTSTGRDITQMINAIQEVLHFHEIDQNLQVKQFITIIYYSINQKLTCVVSPQIRS